MIIADPVPEFTRYVPYNPMTKLGTIFLNSKSHPISNFSDHAHYLVAGHNRYVQVDNPLRVNGQLPTTEMPSEVSQFLADNSIIIHPADNADQAVFYMNDLQAGQSQSVRFTVQAQYTDPAGIPGHDIENFDYLGYFADNNYNVITSTKNDSGIISTPLTGSVNNAPSLSLSKAITATTRNPGESFMTILLLTNHGLTAAEDVFIEDSLPSGIPLMTPDLTQVVNGGEDEDLLKSAIVFLTNSSSAKTSQANYFVTLDTSNVLHVGGLHLEPGASMAIGYVAQVPATAPAPETLISGASFIGAGGGNVTTLGSGTNDVTYSVPPGTPASTPISVVPAFQLVADPPSKRVAQPFVSTDPNATMLTLDSLYAGKNENADPYVRGSNPARFIPGVQRYLLHYAVMGSGTATDVHLQYATPANTLFYRAALLMADGKLAKPVPGQIVPPTKLGTGATTFNFGDLAAGVSGDAMVEVICESSAVQTAGSVILSGMPVIYSGAAPAVVLKPLALTATSSGLKTLDAFPDNTGNIVYDGTNVPSVGIIKVVPQSVPQGQQYSEQFVIINYGAVTVSQNCLVQMHAPAGTQIVSVAADQGFVQSQTATDLSVQFYPAVSNPLQAPGLTVTLVASGTWDS